MSSLNGVIKNRIDSIPDSGRVNKGADKKTRRESGSCAADSLSRTSGADATERVPPKWETCASARYFFAGSFFGSAFFGSAFFGSAFFGASAFFGSAVLTSAFFAALSFFGSSLAFTRSLRAFAKLSAL